MTQSGAPRPPCLDPLSLAWSVSAGLIARYLGGNSGPPRGSRSVAVSRRERIAECVPVQGALDLGDAVADGAFGLEAQDSVDLVEADPVVPRVFVLVHENDIAFADALTNERDDVDLPVVLGRLSDV